jgi:hypothetical protein
MRHAPNFQNDIINVPLESQMLCHTSQQITTIDAIHQSPTASADDNVGGYEKRSDVI